MSIKCVLPCSHRQIYKYFLIKHTFFSQLTKNKRMKGNEEHINKSSCVSEKPIINTPLYKSYKGCKLDIIYENDHFLVVNKPYDIKLEKGKYDDEYPSVETLIRNEREIGLFRMCGQLDYATSGLLIIAKSKLVSNIINYNIECKNICKIYLAILYGHLPLHLLHVTAPISRAKHEFKMKLCYNYNDDYYETGKHCYSLIYPYKHCYLENEKVTLCEMRTITGRRHQLRLHSVSIGSSIVGDETYFEDALAQKYKINSINGKEASAGIFKKIDASRMMLHCWIILNNTKKKQKLKTSEGVNNIEKEIFSENYIICNDELSPFVNEKKRSYEECVLKDDNLINKNFVNYNVYNVNKNLKRINNKLNKHDHHELLLNSLVRERMKRNINDASSEAMINPLNKIDTAINNLEKTVKQESASTSSSLCTKQIATVNVTDKKINKEQLNPSCIYKVENDCYLNPNALFDEIRDNVNKFNWG